MIREQVREALAALVAGAMATAPEEQTAASVEAPETTEEATPAETAAAATEEEAPEEPAPLRDVDYPSRGFHLEVTVAPEQVVAAAEILDRAGFFIEAVTGVDWLADNQYEVVYDYNHMAELCRVAVRTRVDREQPEVPTISNVYPGANWHERETHDFFGIVFTGHPDLSPLLLPEDADFHPLRKDYKP